MRLPGLAVGFAPWLLFLVMPHRLNDGALTFTAVVATVAALSTAPWTRRRAGIELLGGVAVPAFVGVALLSGVEPVGEWLRAYASGAMLFVLAAAMFASLLWTPFTERYAQEALPVEYWRSPHLHRLNMRISATWAVCTFTAAVSVTVAQVISRPDITAPHQYLILSLTWLLPILAISVAARYTSIVTDIGSTHHQRKGVPS